MSVVPNENIFLKHLKGVHSEQKHVTGELGVAGVDGVTFGFFMSRMKKVEEEEKAEKTV